MTAREKLPMKRLGLSLKRQDALVQALDIEATLRNHLSLKFGAKKNLSNI